jgi:hypothetical protein
VATISSPYREVTVNGFGGLNVVSDPQEVGWSGATDLLNVDLSQPGRVRARDGYAVFSTSATTGAIKYLIPLIINGEASRAELHRHGPVRRLALPVQELDRVRVLRREP